MGHEKGKEKEETKKRREEELRKLEEKMKRIKRDWEARKRNERKRNIVVKGMEIKKSKEKGVRTINKEIRRGNEWSGKQEGKQNRWNERNVNSKIRERKTKERNDGKKKIVKRKERDYNK